MTRGSPPDGDRPPYKGLLNPADKVVIAYLIIITSLALIFRHRIEAGWQLIAAHAAGVAAVFAMALWEGRARSSLSESASPSRRASLSGRVARFVHAWYPVAVIPITFTELRYLIPRIHPRDFDRELAAIDYRLFGVHPTVWLERLMWPPATELLQISYVTYYFLPIVLGAVLWRKGWRERYYFFVFIVAIGFYLSYLGYMAVPAIGPRFILADQQTRPLAGIFLFEQIRATLDEAEGITRDCFPSGHTEMTLLVLYYAWRFHRRTFWWLLPAGSAIIISTVYLRYHYVIDIAAGAMLALAVVIVAKPVYRALGGRIE